MIAPARSDPLRDLAEELHFSFLGVVLFLSFSLRVSDELDNFLGVLSPSDLGLLESSTS